MILPVDRESKYYRIEFFRNVPVAWDQVYDQDGVVDAEVFYGNWLRLTIAWCDDTYDIWMNLDAWEHFEVIPHAAFDPHA